MTKEQAKQASEKVLRDFSDNTHDRLECPYHYSWDYEDRCSIADDGYPCIDTKVEAWSANPLVHPECCPIYTMAKYIQESTE